MAFTDWVKDLQSLFQTKPVNTALDTSKLTEFDPSNIYNDAVGGITAAGSRTVDLNAGREPVDAANANLSNLYKDVQNTPDSITNAQTDLQNTIGSLQNKNMSVTKEGVDAVSSLRAPNPFNSNLAEGVSRLNQYSQGINPADTTIANRAKTSLAGSLAASTMKQSQRIASNPYLSEGAKQAGFAELSRMAGSQQSQLEGKLAEDAQLRAYNATKDYTQLALDAAKYDEAKFQFDVGVVGDTLNRELSQLINTGAMQGTLLNNVTDVWGTQTNAKVNIATTQANNTINVYTTEIAAQKSDLDRAVTAAVSVGTLRDSQVQGKYKQFYDAIDFQLRNTTNELNAYSNETNRIAVGATIANLMNETIATLDTSFRSNLMLSQETFVDTNKRDMTAKDVMEDPVLMAEATNLWRLDNPDKPDGVPDETWIASKLRKSPTTSRYEHILTNNDLYEIKTDLVDDNPNGPAPGKISPTTFDQLSSFITTNKFLGVETVISTDGVTLFNADGTPRLVIKNGQVTYDSKTDDSKGDPTKPTDPTKPIEVDDVIIPAGTQPGDNFISPTNKTVVFTYQDGKPIENPNAIIQNGTIITVKSGTPTGGLFVGEDGSVYKNDGTKPVVYNKSTMDFTTLQGLTMSDPVIQALLPEFKSTDPSTLWGQTGDKYKGTDQLLRITGPDGNEILVRYVGNSSEKNPSGSRTRYLGFETIDEKSLSYQMDYTNTPWNPS